MGINVEKLNKSHPEVHVSAKNAVYEEWKKSGAPDRRRGNPDRRTNRHTPLFASHGIPKRRWLHGRRSTDRMHPSVMS